MWTNLAAVFHALHLESDPETRTKMMFEGFKECTRPGILGGVFLIVALVFISIGLSRALQRVEGMMLGD
jgi:hypothetical protein